MGKTDVMYDSFVFNGALENKTAIFIVRNIHADESAAGKLKKSEKVFLICAKFFV